MCSSRREFVWRIFSVASNGVKYGCFSIEADEDLQVLFHCRRQFPEVRTTELFVEMLGPLHDLEAQQVASPTFGIYNEAEAGGCVGELGDTVTAAPHALFIPPVQRDPNPLVDEALRADDSDDEPPFIDGDSDDGSGSVPTQQRGVFSFRTQQYPHHLSNLNLDTLSGPGRAQGEPSSDT
ncbi:hypothetical protein PIB30_076159 [Stylosanthes scabra]|uniref:Uncharacterized protein n=1 Tax=Stylosanthes scabra TaxID=79078 RepID=A0ABU6YQW8_9FABA|nr:hypothetical protein [Stylosanthes scabra]